MKVTNYEKNTELYCLLSAFMLKYNLKKYAIQDI